MEKDVKCKICNGNVHLINETCNLGECTNCKFIFCLTTFSQQEFITVYDALYKSKNSHYQRHASIEYQEILSGKPLNVGVNRSLLIKKNILKPSCKSVLEIGSGIGLIGSYLRQKRDTIIYTGIEIDKEAFEKSQSLNLNTIHGDFKEMEHLNTRFDVIMLWEVIEHLQDLKLFLELAYEKLNDNGKVILSTPNYNKIYNYPNRHKDQLFQDQPPIHINFFTPINIKNIFEMQHFKNCKSHVKRFPFLNLTSFQFYLNTFKSFFNRYNGSTIYFEATKIGLNHG